MRCTACGEITDTQKSPYSGLDLCDQCTQLEEEGIEKEKGGEKE